MKFHTQSAFLGDSCLQTRCTKRRLQGHPYPLTLATERSTALFISLEDTVATTATTPAAVTIPIANFDTSSDFEPVVFEPILNVPALITFVLITTIFSALILRTNQVEDAVQIRKQRQEDVRALKAKEIAEGDVSRGEIEQILKLYEDAARQEERLRNILPGVRIVPPSSSDRKEEEAQAIAKQYLGQDFNIGVPKRYNEPRDGDSEGGLPNVAIGVLAIVALSQIGLLAFFNFGADPMSGNGALM